MNHIIGMSKNKIANANSEIPQPVLDALKGSGFPFQTAVAHVIECSKEWYVDATEYPWRGPEHADRFLDIVALGKELLLAIECKKSAKENWTFLLPLGGESSTGQVEDFRCLNVVEYEPGRATLMVRHETWNVWPPSPSSEFCIIGSGGSGSQRLLERDASLLIGATEALARDVKEYHHHKHALPCPFLVIPVIVTNAPLFTARYEPTEVSLDSGEFGDRPSEMKSVSFIRFAKTLIAGQGRDVGYRSIFVVNATQLPKFLTALAKSTKQPTDKNSKFLGNPRR